jgi:hypothetical protein
MPTCGKQTEVYSRVVGYHRPVRHWNKGKQAEFKDRRPYAVPAAPAAGVGRGASLTPTIMGTIPEPNAPLSRSSADAAGSARGGA